MDRRRLTADLILISSYQLVEKLVGYLVVVMLVRHLAVARVGEFFFAVTLATFATTFTEMGTHVYLIRRVAQDPEGAGRALGEVLSARAPLVAGMFVALNAGVACLGPGLARIMLLVSGFVLLQGLYFSFGAFFLGTRRVGLRVATGLGGQLLLAALVASAIGLGGGLEAVLTGYVTAGAVTVAVAALLARRTSGPIRICWQPAMTRGVLRQSAPLFALGALCLFHEKADTLMLGLIRSYEAVASYEAAYKFLEVSRFVIRPASMIFLPVCAGLAAARDWRGLQSLSRGLILGAIALGAAFALVALPFAGVLLELAFGPAYRSSTPLLRLLLLSVPAAFLGMTGVFVASALHLERRAIRAALVSLLANIAANGVAIPCWGPKGAAWTTLLTQTIFGVWVACVVLSGIGQLSSGATGIPAEPAQPADAMGDFEGP